MMEKMDRDNQEEWKVREKSAWDGVKLASDREGKVQ